MVLNKEVFKLVILSPQVFGLALSSSMSLVHQTTGLIMSIVAVEQEFVSLERIAMCLELTEYTNIEVKPDSVGNADLGVLDGSIQMTNVSVHYGTFAALKDVTFSIQSGSRVMVIGRTGRAHFILIIDFLTHRTGSGKSTLLHTLVRMVPYIGSVKIGGVELTTIPRSKISELISAVPQEPLVFQGSLRMNLDPGGIYTDDELMKCACLSGLHNHLKRTDSDLLDFPIDEKGRNLSHGQRQLVHITRALLRKCALLILDEVTAYLDQSSEADIYESLMSHDIGCTLIVICHRMDSLHRHCDAILEFDSGHVNVIKNC